MPVGPLIDFLEVEAFPRGIVDFAKRYRGELDHMLYDVGIDYVVRDGHVTVTKSAFYGVF